MRSRGLLVSLCMALSCAVHAAGGGSVPDLAACADVDASERAGCVGEALAAGPVRTRDLDRLLSAAGRVPGAVIDTVLEADRRLEENGAGSEDRRATMLEIAARAAMLDGNTDRAADLWERSIRLDPGTDRIREIARSGETRWTTEVGPGNGRIARAAESWITAGRRDEARTAAGRAMALGSDAGSVWKAAGGGEPPGVDRSPAPFMLPAWFEPVGELSIPGIDGTPLDLSAMRGDVVLLDFWASWCGPCLVELPSLQELYEREAPRGLRAVAVNSDEPAEVALSTARRLGLTMPIGAYDTSVDRRFRVRTLPTVILLDRRGRVRARWDGYRAGIEEEIRSRVTDLLEGPDEPPPGVAGTVLSGSGHLRVAWARELERPVLGLAAATFGELGPVVVAANGKALVSFGPSGSILGRVAAEAAAGPLEAGDVTGDRVPDLVGFHPGSRRVAIVDLAAGAATAWDAPEPCFHVRPLAGEEGRPPGLVLATTGGVYETNTNGKRRSAVEVPALSTSAVSEIDGTRLAVLGSAGEIVWVETDGRIGDTTAAAPEWRWLFPSPGGVLAATAEITGLAPGRFVPGGEWLAVGTRSGVVSVVSSVDGALLYRAVLGEPVLVAAADLDGDGLDELAIAWGNRIAVLAAVPKPGPEAPVGNWKEQILQSDNDEGRKRSTD